MQADANQHVLLGEGRRRRGAGGGDPTNILSAALRRPSLLYLLAEPLLDNRLIFLMFYPEILATLLNAAGNGEPFLVFFHASSSPRPSLLPSLLYLLARSGELLHVGIFPLELDVAFASL